MSKYTAQEVFDEANDAISRCPQGEPYDRDQHIIGCATFDDIIADGDVTTMLEIFGSHRTLFHSGYWECLPKELCRDMRIAKGQRDIRIALADYEFAEQST